MTAIERAEELKREGERLLLQTGLLEALEPCGEVQASGSYFLDAMAYPDIDLFAGSVPVGEVLRIAGQLAEHPLVTEVFFEKARPTMPGGKARADQVPGGLYLKPTIEYGSWGRPWKVDIWFLDPVLIAEKMAPMRRFRSRLTPSLREQIVTYKLSILTPEGRTPRFSGMWIYKAFLEEGMTDFRQVSAYLRAQGVCVD